MYSNVVFLLFQEDAEDRLVVADKLATAQEWLKEMRKKQKEVDADRKMLEAEDDCLVAHNALVCDVHHACFVYVSHASDAL